MSCQIFDLENIQIEQVFIFSKLIIEECMTHTHNLTASISVQELSVRYANGHHALFDMNFALTGGTACALVGVNGSGKSTLFKTIMGVI